MKTPMPMTNVEQGNHAWFALADAEHCRLLCCRLTAQGTQHVEEYDALKNTLPEQEHARPTTGGMTHYVEEEERRFAGEIVQWLQKQAQAHRADCLTVFAPPRMLGVLRTVPLGPLIGRVEELQGDLMRLRAGQLADHPMVRQLVLTADE